MFNFSVSFLLSVSILYLNLLWLWYFVLRLYYAESKYTPKLLGFLYCFLLMLKSSIPGYGYIYPCGVWISGHIEIEFCRKLDKRCNSQYPSEKAELYSYIRENHQGQKYWIPLVYYRLPKGGCYSTLDYLSRSDKKEHLHAVIWRQQCLTLNLHTITYIEHQGLLKLDLNSQLYFVLRIRIFQHRFFVLMKKNNSDYWKSEYCFCTRCSLSREGSIW